MKKIDLIEKKISFLFTNRKWHLTQEIFAFLGAFWSITEITSFFWEDFYNFANKNIILFAFISGLSVVIGIIRSLPKSKISKKFTNLNDISITIEVGELLDKKGNIIIGSSDFFDTSTTQTNSIKRQLINKHFNGVIGSLDSQIDLSLNSQSISGTNVQAHEKPHGKTIRYNIGDTAYFNLPSNTNTEVFISAICKIVYNGNNKSKHADVKMLTDALDKIWVTIRNRNNNKDIYTPILGAGKTGLSISKLTICQLLIMSFLINSKNSNIGKSLNIIIPERNYNPEMFDNLQKFINSFSI